ncbi:alpha/beta fold hydrolase [Acetobacterium sp.]|jgi:pimeloyl-ACP methyl ester carboxylesterase|uniref:alpha/beta fold hydrolase n=1 Tax=Acetobacterium sp. TaxID=1872094 RepID=UPI000CB89BBD|nr:alpha/beta hydrolase [Acetobacterium sp.]MDO9491732.1 alpha/beta hydrolase [Acetobacterium sp.]PKM74855.1 MAG: alpha/beta hydrolase [Firmicutes bacterium HGW-Firmicutes-17]
MITVGDINMGYRIYGEGDPLILIMGYGSTMDLWEDRLIQSFAKDYQVIIFDNRGMGETSAGEKDFSIEQFAEDTYGLMESLNLKSAHVLGWSMGSYIAQELVIKYPEKFNKLVLYATTCDPSMYPPAAEVMTILSDPSGTPEDQGARWIRLLFPADWLINHSQRIKEIFYRPLGLINPENIEKQSLAIEKWPGTCSQLTSLFHNTLLITGADDVLVPAENSDYMASKITNSKLAKIPGAGHGLMFQSPEQFTATVCEFLISP